MFYIEKRRLFNWISSSNSKNADLLNELDKKMSDFYSNWNSRNEYQQMLDSNNSNDPGLAALKLLEYLKKIGKTNFLEIGCGSGKMYGYINEKFNLLQYTGIEVSENVIKNNRIRFPNANWLVADAYNIPLSSESVDVCFSFYVLEHLVYLEKALLSMLRVIKKNGFLILIFPDFVSSGRFASQFIGLSNETTAFRKLKKGRILDALISLYDSRIRLPKALRNASKHFGSFPVNLSPKCLTVGNIAMAPDIDAIYIASKEEIADWSIKKGYKTLFPAGKNGYFSEHAFVSIQKTTE